MRLAWWLSYTAFALTAGCSLLFPLSGFSDAAPGGADADVEPPGSGPLDAEPRSDGESPKSEGDAAPPDAAGSFCRSASGSPKFCVDFDNHSLVSSSPATQTDFEAAETRGGAALPVLDEAIFGSAAPSAKFRVAPSAGGWLRRTFAATPTRVVLSFGMRVEMTSGYLELTEVRFGNTDLVVFVRLTDGTNLRAFVERPTGTVNYQIGPTITPGSWHRYTFDIRIAESEFDVMLDETKVVSASLAPLPNIGPGLEMVAGCTWATQSATVWVDDVTADY